MRTYSKRFLSFFTKKPAARGFTIIELLVVSLIVILITATILFRQQGFNSSTLLRSLSYSVALSVRQAQVYGVSVREQTNQSGASTGVFAQGYGVQFSNAGCSLSGVNRYQLFADVNDNGVLNTGEELPCYTIGNGKGTDYKVSKFCAHQNPSDGGATVCYLPPPATPDITSLNIYFRRPNPDACFATSAQTGACVPGATAKYDYAYIQLQAAGDTANTRTVKVTNTGQITVCKLNADPTTC